MTDANRKNLGDDERNTDRNLLGEADRDAGSGRLGNAPKPREDIDVLSNAVQRTDNAFNGIENDESLIGTDITDEEDEDLDEIDRKHAGQEAPDAAVRDRGR